MKFFDLYTSAVCGSDSLTVHGTMGSHTNSELVYGTCQGRIQYVRPTSFKDISSRISLKLINCKLSKFFFQIELVCEVGSETWYPRFAIEDLWGNTHIGSHSLHCASLICMPTGPKWIPFALNLSGIWTVLFGAHKAQSHPKINLC